MIDRYTYYNLEFLERNVDITSQHTMKDLFDSYDKDLIHSTPGVRTDLFRRPLDQVKITDFFGNVQNVEIGGQSDVIDENLLLQQEVVVEPSVEVNESEVVEVKRAIPVAGLKGFEVKPQQGKVWEKGIAIIVCIVLWIIAKQL